MLPLSSSSNRKQIWTMLALFMLIVLALQGRGFRLIDRYS